jgi:hypothetical protein
LREFAAGRPGAAFEHAGQGHLVVGQGQLARTPWASSSSSATVSARHSTMISSPGCQTVRAASGSRSCSTPVSSSRPPLRYSGRPVSLSRPRTFTPDQWNGSSSEYVSHCDSLWNGTQPSDGPSPRTAAWRQTSPSGTPPMLWPSGQMGEHGHEDLRQDVVRVDVGGVGDAALVGHHQVEDAGRAPVGAEHLGLLGHHLAQAAQQHRAAVQAHQRVVLAHLEGGARGGR